MPWYDPRSWFSPPPAEQPWVWPTPAAPAAGDAKTDPFDHSPGKRLPRRTRGWTDVSRHAAPATEGQLRGWSGTRVHAGRVAGHENNPELQGDGWPLREREMRRTDYSVGAAWRAARDTLLSASWCFVPGDPEDEVSRMLADEANKLFGFAGYPGRLRRPWELALEQAILYYPVGFRFGEVRFAWGADGRIDVVDPWVDRLPESLDRWVFDDEGEWIGVLQKPPVGDLGQRLGPAPFIPADELVYLAHGVEGMALEGCGAHRPIWDAYSRKRDIEDLAMEATERWARGVPRIKIHHAAAAEANLPVGELERQVEKVRQGLISFLLGDCAWFEETEFVEVDRYGGDLDPSRSLQQIEALDGATKGAVLLQWLNLGTTPTGSRSVGQVHRDLWIASLVQVLDRIAAAYNGLRRPGGGVIGRWIELNWPGIAPEQYPRLEHAGLATDPLADALTAGIIDRLSAAGWLDPDSQVDRDRVRHRIGLALEKRARTPAITPRPDGADPTTPATAAAPRPDGADPALAPEIT